MSPSHDTDGRRDERIRKRLKATPMILRPTAFVVVTSGLIVAAGLSSGCQVPRAVRSFETPPFPWRRGPVSRPSPDEYRPGSETYVPETFDAPRSIPQPQFPEQRGLRLPPEPSFNPVPAPDQRPIPVPPAVDVESPQARRWMPSRPNRQAASVSQSTRVSESVPDDLSLPPARVTYNAEGTSEEPVITPAPEHQSNSQPRLFRPAGTAKNMFESVKRKFSH